MVDERTTSNGNGNGHAPEVRNLVGGLTEIADRSPVPLPRDAGGRPQPHGAIYEPPTPKEGTLQTSYAEAVRGIGQRLPLHAARLKDLMERADEALRRFRTLRREELQRKELSGRDTRADRGSLDAEIAATHDEIEAIRAARKPAIDERVAAWGSAREEATQIFAEAGQPFHRADDDDLSDTFSPAPLEPVTVAAPVDERRSGLGFWKRLTQRQPPPGPAAMSEEPQPAPAPELVEEPVRERWYERFSRRKPEASRGYDPVVEARTRIRSEEAVAAELGLPYPSPATRTTRGWPHMVGRFLALIALGSVFGLSIGLITRLVQMTTVQDEPIKTGICAALGVAAFWGMGKLTAMLSAAAAQDLLHDPDADALVRRLRKYAMGVFVMMFITGAALILIESFVEYHGVLGSLMKEQWKHSLTGGAPVGPEGLEKAGVWMVCLAVSFPFILFHMTESWIEARADAIQNIVHGVREREVWSLADVLREKHEAAVAEESRPESGAPATPSAAITPVAPPASEPLEARPEPVYTTDNNQIAPATDDGPTPARLALARERVFQAARSLREERAREFEALEPVRLRAADLEARRKALDAPPESDAVANQRLEDAYADYLGAVRTFDLEYRLIMDRLERLSQRGFWVRVADRVFGDPANGGRTKA